MFPRSLSIIQFYRIVLPNRAISQHPTPSRARHGKLMIPLSKSPPQTFMRRLLEAAGEPILPTDPDIFLQKPAAVRCKRPAIDEEKRKREMQLTPRELAYRNYLRKHLDEATVVILCHEHPTDTRTQHYDIMEMSANGIGLIRQYSGKLMRSVLEGSTLEPFAAFFDDDVEMQTSLLITKRYVKEEDDGRNDIISGKIRDGNYLPVALRYAKKTPWVVPLGVIFEDQLLPVSDAERLVTMMKNPLQVRAETVALLNQPITETIRLLGDHSSTLSAALQSRIDQLKNEESKPPSTEN